MRKQTKNLIIASTIAILITLLAGCDGVLVLTADPEYVYYTNVSGSTVNAMSTGDTKEYWKDGTDSLTNSTLKFYKKNTNGTYSTVSSASATVDAYGSYTVRNIAMGEYKIQGEKTGWVFVPRKIDIAGENMTLPPISAYKSQGNNALVIVLSWEDKTLDLDGHLTFYDENTETNRNRVFYGNKIYAVSGVNTIIQERDVLGYNINSPTVSVENQYTSIDIPRVETIVVKHNADAPYYSATGTTDSISNKDLIYYVHSFSKVGGLTGVDDFGGDGQIAFSDAQVDIMYTDSTGTTKHYGGFIAPWNTYETNIAFARITANTDGSFTVASTGNANEDNGDPIFRSTIGAE